MRVDRLGPGVAALDAGLRLAHGGAAEEPDRGRPRGRGADDPVPAGAERRAARPGWSRRRWWPAPPRWLRAEAPASRSRPTRREAFETAATRTFHPSPRRGAAMTEQGSSVADLIARLKDQGVELWFEGERLRFRAPKGSLTAELRARLAASRTEVLAQLRAAAAAQVQIHPLSYSQRSALVPVPGGPLQRSLQRRLRRPRGISRRRGGPPAGSPGARRSARCASHHLRALQRGAVPARCWHQHRRARGARGGWARRGRAPRTRRLGLPAAVRSGARAPLQGRALHACPRGPRSVAGHASHRSRRLVAPAAPGRAPGPSPRGDAGPPASLARPETDYAAFTAAQASALAGPEGEQLAAYWTRQLDEPRAWLELPTTGRGSPTAERREPQPAPSTSDPS